MRDSKTTTPLIAADFVIEQYSSGSLNVQYARSSIDAAGHGGVANIEQLPFILGVKGPCSIRRATFPPAEAVVDSLSDEPYTVTFGKTILTKDI